VSTPQHRADTLAATVREALDTEQPSYEWERFAAAKTALSELVALAHAGAETERLREALTVLLEWAEKDRGGGYPEANRSEEWYTHRDFARAALAGGQADTTQAEVEQEWPREQR